MRRVLFLVVLVPLAIVIVILSVANRGAAVFSLDPFGGNALSFAAPLFVFLFAALALGIVVGGIAAWMRQGKWRQAARLERAEAARLRNEAERLRDPPGPTPARPATRDAA